MAPQTRTLTRNASEKTDSEKEEEIKTQPKYPEYKINPDIAAAYLWRICGGYEQGGYIWPGLITPASQLQKIKDFKFRSTDILICSYPKSGTTWLSEIMSLIVHKGDSAKTNERVLHDRVPWIDMKNDSPWMASYLVWKFVLKKFEWLGDMFGIKYAWINDPDEHEVDESTAQRRVFFSHVPVEFLPQQVLDGKVKVLYVCRNPKDNAVSFFHYHSIARYLGLQSETTWDDFYACWMAGKTYAGSWFDHVTKFYDFSKKYPKNVKFIVYEDMKKNLHNVIKHELLPFIGESLSDEVIKSIVVNTEFNTMKANPMSNREGVLLFDDNLGSFMRKGIVGDWKNKFTISQSEEFDEYYKLRMKDYPELKFAYVG